MTREQAICYYMIGNPSFLLQAACEPMTRVLIVDDQPSFRRHLRQLLSHAGLTVVGEAGDIPAAKELVRELKPDIAIVDVMLPGESGVAGISKLKALAENLRVILVSAHHDSAQLFQKSAQESGAEAFIPKDELDLDLVRKWMEKSDI
jgi:two-component system nitrate/nitrite response regulator NarL